MMQSFGSEQEGTHLLALVLFSIFFLSTDGHDLVAEEELAKRQVESCRDLAFFELSVVRHDTRLAEQ